MHEENEKPQTGCTPEYCAKPDVNDNIPARPAAEEILMINAAMQEKIMWLSVQKKD